MVLNLTDHGMNQSTEVYGFIRIIFKCKLKFLSLSSLSFGSGTLEPGD